MIIKAPFSIVVLPYNKQLNTPFKVLYEQGQYETTSLNLGAYLINKNIVYEFTQTQFGLYKYKIFTGKYIISRPVEALSGCFLINYIFPGTEDPVTLEIVPL